MSIGYSYFHISFNRWLGNYFESLLENGMADVHYCPPDVALNRRLDRKGIDPDRYLQEDGDLTEEEKEEVKELYDFPFISFYNNAVGYAENLANYPNQANGLNVTIPNVGNENVEIDPVRIDYEVNYWDTDGSRKSEWNRLWNKNFPSKEVGLQYPITDDGNNLIVGNMQGIPEEPTDNSDIERMYETGVQFRMTAKMTFESYHLDIDTTSEELYEIQEINMNMYIEEVEDVLVDQFDIT